MTDLSPEAEVNPIVPLPRIPLPSPVTMRWPPWSSPSPSPPPPSPSDNNTPFARQRQRLADLWTTKADVLLPTLILTSSILALIYGYRNYVRRIPDVTAISPNFFRRRSIFGKVTSVGDGDGFRLFHTPGGRLLGWGWFPGRKVPETRAELKEKTVSRVFSFPPPLPSLLPCSASPPPPPLPY